MKTQKDNFKAPILIVGAFCLILGYFFGAWANGAFNPIGSGLTVEKITAEKNQDELRDSPPPTTTIKKAGGNKAVYAIDLKTPYYGNIGISGAIDLSPFEKRHAIGLGVSVVNTEILGRIAYQYKGWDFSLFGGYDMLGGGYRVGAGLGYYWRF